MLGIQRGKHFFCIVFGGFNLLEDENSHFVNITIMPRDFSF